MWKWSTSIGARLLWSITPSAIIPWKHFPDPNALSVSLGSSGNCWRMFAFRSFKLYTPTSICPMEYDMRFIRKNQLFLTQLKSSCGNGVQILNFVASQHRYINQVPAEESHTQLRSLNRQYEDTVCSPLSHLSCQFLNGYTFVRPKPQFNSAIYDSRCTTFAMSLIFDSVILPYTLYFHHDTLERFTKLPVSEISHPYSKCNDDGLLNEG